jgi:hypothetical protein
MFHASPPLHQAFTQHRNSANCRQDPRVIDPCCLLSTRTKNMPLEKWLTNKQYGRLFAARHNRCSLLCLCLRHNKDSRAQDSLKKSLRLKRTFKVLIASAILELPRPTLRHFKVCSWCRMVISDTDHSNSHYTLFVSQRISYSTHGIQIRSFFRSELRKSD